MRIHPLVATLSALAFAGAPSAFSEEKPAAAVPGAVLAPVKAQSAVKAAAPAQPAALPAMDPDAARLLTLSKPRNAMMADLSALNARIAARRDEIRAGNEAVGKLEKEIAELDAQITEKSAELHAIFDKDEVLAGIGKESAALREDIAKEQAKIRAAVRENVRRRAGAPSAPAPSPAAEAAERAVQTK